ncbi:hypothetical protein Clacol_000680 [Clathrus columnatus]|uniref:Vesicular-fusion protein SEC18 n=1 Tax=Clathrus columnatus TaxID=1419009 RepID=A0AAV4ZZX5_9AGAM|nr:hypothetical protein Clacol_000680 [Clathrus columnatus]
MRIFGVRAEQIMIMEQPAEPPPNSAYGRIPDYNSPSRSPAPPQDRRPAPGQRVINDKFPTSQSQGGSFGVVECPSPTLALSNCLIVHPGDFPQGLHVVLNNKFPLTTKHDNTGKLLPGQIGVSSSQRQWMSLSLMGDQVSISPLKIHPADIYLAALDLEVGFWKRGLEIAEQFSPEEMVNTFIRAFNGLIFSIDQPLVFEFHGQNLKAIVKSLGILELSAGQRKGAAPPPARSMNMGVVMDKTDVNFFKAPDSKIKIKSSSKRAPANAIIAPNFKFEDMGIGGLDSEFGTIFRRAFASRVFPPGLVEKLGIQHVKGILLFGPPGTGKTLMARQIGKMLNAREPKIVNGPEILNKYVGASEENIRKLFAEAEQEYKAKGDESGLHIIIFDELDAICKQRGSGAGGGTGVGDSVVNQLLSKMDGVDQLNNILLIGMTNRLDMIDEALLRPGRLEVHMEISLPDEHGRLQILNIHTAKMRSNNIMDGSVNLPELAALTKNFSGAEIAGLVKSATSFAFNRHVKVGTMAGISDDVDQLRINREDFLHALDEVQPAFGVSEEELTTVIQNGIYHFSSDIERILHDSRLLVEQVKSSTRTRRVSLLLYGPPGSGKTALAATIAKESGFPFIKLISAETMVGFSDSQQVSAINKVFADSYKSPLSVIVLDNIERLLGKVEFIPRRSVDLNFFNKGTVGSASTDSTKGRLFYRRLKETLIPWVQERRLLIIATTSIRATFDDFQLSDVFEAEIYVPPVVSLSSVDFVFKAVQLFDSDSDRINAIRKLQEAGFGDDDNSRKKVQLGIKKLLSIIEMARQEPEEITHRLIMAFIGLGM